MKYVTFLKQMEERNHTIYKRHKEEHLSYNQLARIYKCTPQNINRIVQKIKNENAKSEGIAS